MCGLEVSESNMRVVYLLFCYFLALAVPVSTNGIRGSFGNHSSRESIFNAKRQVKKVDTSHEVQHHAQWSMAMLAMGKKIDFSEAPLAGYDYEYYADAGKGVDLYVIDSGFNMKHKDLFGRVKSIGRFRPAASTLAQLKHGTCSASLAGASKTFGVAKKANILVATALKPGSIIRAIREIVSRHQEKANKRSENPGWAGSVISITLSSDKLTHDWDHPLVRAAKVAEAAGVLIVWSAGNLHKDLTGGNDDTPLRPPFQLGCMLPGVLCVGNVNKRYSRDSKSNFGPPVSLWAAGDDIYCSGYTERVSGTSLASPLVAGIAAIMLGYDWAHEKRFQDNTFFLKLAIMGNAKPGLLEGIGNTRNLLANTGINSGKDSSIPFLNVDLLKTVEAEEKLTSINVADFGDDLPHFECFPIGSAERISWLDAQHLWLNLRWEIGRVNEYEADLYEHKFHPPIPCFGNACVLIKPGPDAPPGARLAAHDVSIWEKIIMHLIVTCSQSNMERAENPWAGMLDKSYENVGGWMQLPGLRHWFIYLQSKTGIENDIAPPTFLPTDFGDQYS